MSASEELLKNLMERAGIKKSRKRPRDTVYKDNYIVDKCKPNTKTHCASSNTDSNSSEENISSLPEKN